MLGAVTVLVLAFSSLLLLLLLLCSQMTCALSVWLKCYLLNEQQLAEVSRNADVWLQGSRKITSALDGNGSYQNVWFWCLHQAPLTTV